MNVFTASSEAYPFSKTGGLGDIAGSLPLELENLNINSNLIIPLYKDNYKLLKNFTIYTAMQIEAGEEILKVDVIKIPHPYNKNVTVYFIKQDALFKRDGIYSKHGIDYEDNAKRFIVFSKCIVKLIMFLYEKEKYTVDILHIHDWQTALSALYIKDIYYKHDAVKNIKVVFTIHNLAYQGNFNTDIYNLLNISWMYFVPKRLEYYGSVSFIKAGIMLSDAVTTVSEAYSKEIQTEKYGSGMNSILYEKKDKLFGILNGIYDKSWNPKTDKYIKNYDYDSIEVKLSIRKKLYKTYGIKNLNYPLAVMISRFDPQKGIDLIYSSFFELSTYKVNFIFLFTKSNIYKDFENMFIKRALRTSNIKIIFDFDESLSHALTGGSDIFLMPSLFEPCGLNQMYSMKYGSLPIVHSVGGLKDTVYPYKNKRSVTKANGFSFDNYDVKSFVDTMDLAFDIYYNDKVSWKNMIKNAMKSDFSLLKTAKNYKKLYEKLL